MSQDYSYQYDTLYIYGQVSGLSSMFPNTLRLVYCSVEVGELENFPKLEEFVMEGDVECVLTPSTLLAKYPNLRRISYPHFLDSDEWSYTGDYRSPILIECYRNPVINTLIASAEIIECAPDVHLRSHNSKVDIYLHYKDSVSVSSNVISGGTSRVVMATDIPKDITSIRIGENIDVFHDSIFRSCPWLESVYIPFDTLICPGSARHKYTGKFKLLPPVVHKIKKYGGIIFGEYITAEQYITPNWRELLNQLYNETGEINYQLAANADESIAKELLSCLEGVDHILELINNK